MFRDRRLGLVAGAALLVAGWYCIHDATKKRNAKVPLPLKPFYPWG